MDYEYYQGKDSRWSAGDTTGTIAHTSQGAAMLAKGLKEGTIKTPTLTSEGACRGICLWWLIKRCLNEDFWAWFGPPQAAAPKAANVNGLAGEPVRAIQEVMRKQERSIAINSSIMDTNQLRALNMHHATTYILDHTKAKGLTNVHGLVVREGTSWDSVANDVAEIKGYCYIGFHIKDWGGHAMAAHVTDGKIEFLDPNQGEFDSETGHFPHFMKLVLGNSYPKKPLEWVGVQTLAPPGQ